MLNIAVVAPMPIASVATAGTRETRHLAKLANGVPDVLLERIHDGLSRT